MPEDPKTDDKRKDDAEQAPQSGAPAPDDGESGTDHQTQYAGVTIDPDHPNDEG